MINFPANLDWDVDIEWAKNHTMGVSINFFSHWTTGNVLVYYWQKQQPQTNTSENSDLSSKVLFYWRTTYATTYKLIAI